jgi:shikimate dehydrogenase
LRPEALSPGTVVADIIMKPRETRLLRAAAALGHRVHYGIHMLTGQVDSYRVFFGLGDDYQTGGCDRSGADLP